MNKIISVCITLAALIITGCGSKAIEPKNFDEVFEKTAFYKAEYETPIPDHIIDAVNYKDSLFFFTTHEGASLFKLDLKTRKINKIAKNGKGPGGYQSPFALQLVNNTLFFNDILDNRLQVIDFNGKYLKEYKIRRFVMSLRFYRDARDLVYLLNGGFGFDNYLARNDDKTFFKVPLKFRDYPLVKAPINMFEDNGILYFASPFEYSIFTLNLAGGSEGTIPLQGIAEPFDWSGYKENKINLDEVKRIEMTLWNSKPVRFEKMVLNGKLYFLFTVTSIREEETNYIIDSSGKGIAAFRTKDNIMFGTHGDRIYFYEIDSAAKILKGFTEYKLKEGIIK